MIYREYLVIRKALAWFVGIFLALVLIGLLSRVIEITPTAPGHVGFDLDPGHARFDVDSGWLAAIFASILGVALGNDSRGPARVLWMLPAARWKLALQIIAVDLAGTTVAFACVYAAMLSVSVIGDPHFLNGTVSAGAIVMALAMAYATYGWSALASVLGRRRAFSGFFALPALMIWMILAQSGETVGTILRAAIVLNPFAVFNAGLALGSWTQHRFTLDPTASSLQWLSTFWATPVLAATAIATCGVTVALWQRAEAIT